MRRSPHPAQILTTARRTLLAASALSLFSAGTSRAQTPCPADTSIAPWAPADIASWMKGSASLGADGAIQLCSATRGFGGAEDGFRFATQTVEGDFTSGAIVTAIEPGGSAGFIVTDIAIPDQDSARIAILAEPQADPGKVRLRVTVRTKHAGPASWAVSQPVVTLPVRLQAQQQDGVLHVGYEFGGAFTVLHSEPLDGTDLTGSLRAGMVQTSNHPETFRSAWFMRPTATLPTLPPAPLCAEDAVLLGDTQALVLKGRWLDRATSVLVGGQPAQILAQSPQRLVVRPPVGGDGFSRSEVMLQTRYSKSPMRQRVVFGGTPVIRGDVNQDGQVTREDWKQICYAVHRSKAPACHAAGDIDGDGAVDATDLDQLKTYLTTGQRPPVGPFPEAGFIAGALSCSLPPGPTLTKILDARSRPIRAALRRGDIVNLIGANLPALADAIVMFGPVVTETLPGSTPTELRLQITSVPKTGTHCPIVMKGFAGEPEDATRFGHSYTVNSGSPLCLAFESDPAQRVLTAQAGRDGTVAIGVPRAAFGPDQRFDVHAAYLMPFVNGAAGGPRITRFSFTTLPSDTRSDGYANSLNLLAATLRKQLNGHNDSDCDCEVKVVSMPADEMVILQPCNPPPPPPPEPVVPGLPTQVKPIHFIVGGISITSPWKQPTCADTFDRVTEPRKFAWCEFLKVVVPGNDGLPRFENFRPVDTISGMNADPDAVKSPHLRTTDEKKILFENSYDAWQDLFAGDYTDPCHLALRANVCNDNFWETWVRPFESGRHLIKTEWRTASRLPLHMDTDKMYSYVDPDGVTQYLVALHVAVSRQKANEDDGYWMWNTFWAPIPFGDTITKTNQDLKSSFSPYCTAGHGNDRPIELLNSVFANWQMCTDSANGEAACGNPWIAGECSQNAPSSCTGCHASKTFGQQALNADDPDELFPLNTGWIAAANARTQARAAACVPEVLADLAQFSDWLLPEHASGGPQMCIFNREP